MRLSIGRRPTPLFAGDGQEFVNDARRWTRVYGSYAMQSHRLDPADELKTLQDIILQVQARLQPQTVWLSPNPRNTTEKVLRWDGMAKDQLELRASPSVADGGLTFTLSAGFPPEVSDLERQGYSFSEALRVSSQVHTQRMLCFWRLSPITVTNSLFEEEDHLGQVDIFRLDACSSSRHSRLTYLDHMAPCLDGRARYTPGYLQPWQRPTRRGGLVDDIVNVTQGFLVAAGHAS